MTVVSTWKKLLLNICKSLFWPNNFILLRLVMPATESLMSEMFESAVSTLKGLNHCTEVWVFNLLLDCLINHWPEHWRLLINVLTLLNISLWRFIWLTRIFLLFLFECWGNDMFGAGGTSNFWPNWNIKIRCRGFLKKTVSISPILSNTGKETNRRVLFSVTL